MDKKIKQIVIFLRKIKKIAIFDQKIPPFKFPISKILGASFWPHVECSPSSMAHLIDLYYLEFSRAHERNPSIVCTIARNTNIRPLESRTFFHFYLFSGALNCMVRFKVKNTIRISHSDAYLAKKHFFSFLINFMWVKWFKTCLSSVLISFFSKKMRSPIFRKRIL